MKFSTALIALMAMVPSTAATGMRNTGDSKTALEHSAADHHRKLASEKYSFAGYGISLDKSWSENCENGSYFYLFVSDGVSKYQSNGKPSKTTSTNAWSGLDIWTDCDETSATHTYAYFDLYGGTDSTLSVSKKLDTASFTMDTVVFSVTETCTKVCYDDEEYGEWCYYGECTTVTDGTVPATISASLTATDVSSPFSSKSTYKTQGYTSRYSSKGKERPASFSLTLALDGNIIEIPVDAYTYASIQQTSSGDFYKF